MARSGDGAARARPYGRRMWGLGDYHRFATTMIWGFGPELVAACDIGPGQRVLDVAAGTGNVALRAAEAGADVVASAAGAIFAPDQQAVADELVRVCRPGGTIGMINFTPGGVADAFFAVFGRHSPSDGAPSPILWGDA